MDTLALLIPAEQMEQPTFGPMNDAGGRARGLSMARLMRKPVV
jgi:hypothetical protein